MNECPVLGRMLDRIFSSCTIKDKNGDVNLEEEYIRQWIKFDAYCEKYHLRQPGLNALDRVLADAIRMREEK